MNAILTGQFISRVRTEKGMTQKELAQKVGVTDKAVSKWETGRGMPDISSLDALCNALDVSVNELLSGEVLPPEFYEKKAEENMKTLIKENEKNTKTNWIQMILGEVLVIVAFVFLAICIGIKMLGNYFDLPSLLYLVLISAGVVLLSRPAGKREIFAALQKAVIPAGALASVVSLIQIFLYAEDMEVIFASVAVALLPIAYGIFLYLLLLPITTHMKKAAE